MRLLAPLLLLAACTPGLEPDPDGPLYGERLGDPIPGLDSTRLAAFERGQEVMLRAFRTDEGLGPTFNADSCHSCHQAPVTGGSSPRYRDFFLVRAEREDGALVDVGTNGASPVRNLYATELVGHIAEPADTSIYARRQAPPFIGIGLFQFVADSEILKREDPDDEDGDGISGRANYEQNRVGRFGVKSQAFNIESFNRGAMINQMGITSNPLFADFPEDAEMAALAPSLVERLFGMGVAHAQVSAPGEPTTDDDGVADPEISDADQLDLLTFSIYLAPPRPAERTRETKAGARLFHKIGCTDCHVPSIESTVGPLYAYTDLLVHDLGDDNGDDFQVALASGNEFRTAPLWGVALHPPYLHDGKAETLQDAIGFHGGEGEASRDAFEALSSDDQDLVIGFLESLGPFLPGNNLKINAEHAPPEAGENGGPEEALGEAGLELFREGELLFDQTRRTDEGLGRPFFNADSCRACHQDPGLGGANGADTSVLRIGKVDLDGNTVPIPTPILFRAVVPSQRPMRLEDDVNVVETRQPPSILGLGRIDALADEVILANADPDDLDGDGISGRARIRGDGRLGRFGWKAQIPTLRDFLADAMLVELGMTANPALSDFTGTDDDGVPDPELSDEEFEALAFYIEGLAPPVPEPPSDSEAADHGKTLFTDIGCAACHVPDLGGVAAYSDFLLHDVASTDQPLTDQEGDEAEPTEFRTAPLWGVVHTGPYLHHGMAPTLHDAILGHAGEADDARTAYEGLDPTDQAALVTFVESL